VFAAFGKIFESPVVHRGLLFAGELGSWSAVREGGSREGFSDAEQKPHAKPIQCTSISWRAPPFFMSWLDLWSDPCLAERSMCARPIGRPSNRSRSIVLDTLGS